MKRLYTLASVVLCVCTPLAAEPVSSEIPQDKEAFIAKAMTAAPPAVGKSVTIVRVNNSSEPMEVLQEGKNGCTCGVDPNTGVPYCADADAMAWYKAAYRKADPPEGPGFISMMTGDKALPLLRGISMACPSMSRWSSVLRLFDSASGLFQLDWLKVRATLIGRANQGRVTLATMGGPSG
jgi:hypothetical protein